MAASLANLERIFKKNPTSIVFARLADELFGQGDLRNAIEVCRKGLKYRPSYTTGHVVLGKCYLALDRLEEARQEFHKVLHLDSNHPAAIWHLACIERDLGWTEASQGHFKQALALDPFNEAVANEVNRQSAEEIPDSAEADLPAIDQPDASSPFDSEPEPETRLDSLVLELTQTEYKPKRSNGLEIEPILTPTLAEIYAAQGLTRQAVAILKKAHQRDPGNQVVKDRLEAYRTSGEE
jgi:tetratricopeptide (TPR) repeat protein